MIDLEKRRRVMERSIKLGHCICNPRKPCPCDQFREQDICLCAGERPEDAPEEVPLTSLVKNAGCASKINQNDLKRVLVGLPELADPRVLVGSNTADDAGVYLLSEDTALVQTVDVFTPGVDDPYVFGQIAAANSLSDVYAMGGRPLTALAVVGFPIETLSPRLMTRILRGGLDKMREAGVPVVGGHSINDLDVKYGFAVTGTVHPQRIVTNAQARPGDLLLLTKPLGVGIISFAAQLGQAAPEALQAAAESMTTLNKAASEAMVAHGVVCATDVTGFGLLGHLSELVRQSGVTAEVWLSEVPTLPQVGEYVRAGLLSGALERNREYASEYTDVAAGVCEEDVHVLYDPQTSGGLLIAVAPERAEALLGQLHAAGQPAAAAIGRIVESSTGRISIVNGKESREADCCCTSATPCSGDSAPAPESASRPEAAPDCCAGTAAQAEPCCCAPEGHGGAIREKFGAFMAEVNAEGALNLREKELLALALSVLSKCEPCVKLHLEKAQAAGLGEAEIEEAVWMAVSFGGAPTMMWAKSVGSLQ